MYGLNVNVCRRAWMKHKIRFGKTSVLCFYCRCRLERTAFFFLVGSCALRRKKNFRQSKREDSRSEWENSQTERENMRNEQEFRWNEGGKGREKERKQNRRTHWYAELKVAMNLKRQLIANATKFRRKFTMFFGAVNYLLFPHQESWGNMPYRILSLHQYSKIPNFQYFYTFSVANSKLKKTDKALLI